MEAAKDCFPNASDHNYSAPRKNGLTSLNKEVRPFFLGDNSTWRVFPLFPPLAITVFRGPEAYLALRS